MDLRGSIRGVQRDWGTFVPLVTIAVTEGNLNELNDYRDKDLAIEIKLFRNKRSLNSNAYAWVLMQKLAQAMSVTKDDIYLMMLQRYSKSFTHIIVKENAIDKVKEMYRTCVDLGEITICGSTGHQLQVYFGSSTFNTEEMSVFINGLVSECKEVGIETLPPQEIERMLESWKENQS